MNEQIDIIATIRNNTEKLTKLYTDLNPEAYDWKKNNQGWNIAQILNHLNLTEEKILAKIKKVYEQNIISSVVQKYKTPQKVLQVISSRQHLANSPKPFEPSQEKIDIEEEIKRFKKRRKKYIEHYNDWDEQNLEMLTMEHGRLGHLTLKNWFALIVGHTQRHIEQINEIIQTN